ncbi:hypothetical protein [Microcoleus sp. D2_18a_B4]
MELAPFFIEEGSSATDSLDGCNRCNGLMEEGFSYLEDKEEERKS